jgi:hypothetical protein
LKRFDKSFSPWHIDALAIGVLVTRSPLAQTESAWTASAWT